MADANGNLTNLPNVSGALSYDIENRTGSTNSLYSNLAYDMENQPLDRGGQWNLYGLNGERLGTYTYTFGRDVTYINGVDYDTTPVYPAQATRNIYFGGRLIQSNNTTVVVDAQGSVRANESGQTFEFYPYGEEMGSGTTNGREKFATYTRESNGLDYANQRYYSSTYGAFTSADPLHQTATTPADPNNPGSWNRFAYTGADPINRIDPLGTSNCAVDSFDDSGDSDDGDVNLGSNCGSGFEPGGDVPNGATRCHSRPGLIFTFNGVPSTCQGGIIIAVDTSHVTQPICTITVNDRGLDILGGVNVFGAAHGYLSETNSSLPGFTYIIEGQDQNGFLKGYDGVLGQGSLPSDNPVKNHHDGSISGAQVCAWMPILNSDVSNINNLTNITYNKWGPNSNSVLRYLLESLPDASWYTIPSLIGYKSNIGLNGPIRTR